MTMLHHFYDLLRTETSSAVFLSMVRLALAGILGGLIGIEREMKHRPAGVRTNMFICFGAAMFTILSDQLQAGHPSGDHTRIAAQIIPGIGFIGAGSILRAHGELVLGLTTAATLFVVASIGMAVGGGLYLTAIFATAVILLALFLLGGTLRRMNLKLEINTYEVSGKNTDEVIAEVNRILETTHSLMKNTQVASTKDHVRVQFDLARSHKQQQEILHGLRQSRVLDSAIFVGPVEPE
jgi:putative Mg2+ transporter-C (MgtC) family protein